MQQEDYILKRDLENWEGLLGGNHVAFAKYYEGYFKIFYNYGGDPAQVEDSIHNLFVDLWRSRSNLSKTTSVKLYLFGSLRRRLAKDNNSSYG